MCVCVCVCVCVCLCVQVYAWLCEFERVYVYVCMYELFVVWFLVRATYMLFCDESRQCLVNNYITPTHTRTHTHTHTHTHTYIYIYICVCVCVCVCVCTRVCVYVCMSCDNTFISSYANLYFCTQIGFNIFCGFIILKKSKNRGICIFSKNIYGQLKIIRY